MRKNESQDNSETDRAVSNEPAFRGDESDGIKDAIRIGGLFGVSSDDATNAALGLSAAFQKLWSEVLAEAV